VKNTSESEHELTAGAERIVQIATVLFAEHGYDGVSTRQIAAATGLSVATVHHHIGTKRALYLNVYKGLLAGAEEFFAKVMTQVAEADLRDPEVIEALPTRLVDSFVDLVAKEPIRARLFMRHWLDGTEDLEEAESELWLSLYRRIHDLLSVAQEAGIVRSDLDLGLFMRSFDWLVYGYFVSGALDADTWRCDPLQPEKLEAFKKFLKEYVQRMLGLGEPSAQETVN